jgi:hypothetical protein
VAGDHDGGRQELALAQLAQELDAAAVREPDIEQEKVGALDCGPGFSDAARERDRVAFALQNQSQGGADVGLVVQNEDAFCGHGSEAFTRM